MGKIVSALQKTGNLIASNHLRQKIFLICVLALFAFVYVMIFAPPTTQSVAAFDDGSPRSEQKISKNSPLEMPLHMTGGYPIALTLYFAEPAYGSKDPYAIDVLDAAGKTVFTNKFSIDSLSEVKYRLSFGLIDLPKTGGEYTLKITGEGIPDETAVSIYTRQSAGITVPEVNVTYSHGISPYVLSLSFITVLAGSILILFYSKKLSVNILATVLVFGVLFALLTPIMDVPDESVHASKAFLVAGGTLFNPPDGGMVSAAKEQVTNLSHLHETIVNTTLQGAAIDPATIRTIYGTNQFFLGYLPAAFIINLFQLLHTNVLTLLYGGRIINLIVYALCAFFAIKIAPRYKLFFGVIAIAPMALYIAASYNGDYLTYGLCLLLAAMFTRFYFQKNFTITYKQIIWFSVVCAIICMIKYYFLPLCLLLLVIPAGRYASGKTKWLGALLCIAITAVAAFGIFGLQQYEITQAGGSSAVGDIPNEMGASVGQQLQFMVHHITSAGAILIRAFVNNASGYLNQLFTFGWLTDSVPNIFVYLYVGFIALAGLVYSKYEHNAEAIVETKHSGVNKLGILIILLMAYGAINILFYLIWNAVGANAIAGVQGRYFIPLLLFLPFLSGNSRPQMDEAAYTKKQNYILFTAQAFIVLSIITTIFANY